jgi:hypothetical protein
MKGGVRGTYIRPIREGTNIALIEPGEAEAFAAEDGVNEALEGVLNAIRAVSMNSAGGQDATIGDSDRRPDPDTRCRRHG